MRVLEQVLRFFREERGQVTAEYGVLLWFFTLVGVATLVTFIFSFEEGVIADYEDILDVICFPIT